MAVEAICMRTLDAPLGSRTVVMVDDDDELRAILRDVLEDAGFEVLDCGSLAAAFALLSSVVPDVVLLDRDLPDGCGLDVARWMRRRGVFDDTRIIGLSGRHTPSDVEAARVAGCDAIVAKPCTSTGLVAEIRASGTSRGLRSSSSRMRVASGVHSAGAVERP
jgi:DNA-binding response OmpR family regulator